MKSPSRIKVTEAEVHLIQRYREQCRAFNDGVAACLKVVVERHAAEIAEEAPITKADLDQIFTELGTDLAQLRKDTL